MEKFARYVELHPDDQFGVTWLEVASEIATILSNEKLSKEERAKAVTACTEKYDIDNQYPVALWNETLEEVGKKTNKLFEEKRKEQLAQRERLAQIDRDHDRFMEEKRKEI